MKRGIIGNVKASIDRRQRSLLGQIATQRMIVARAEARIAELTAELHETAPAGYNEMLARKTADILRRKTEVAS